MNNLPFQHFIVLFVGIFLVFSIGLLLHPTIRNIVEADEIEKIEKEIEKKQSELEKTNEELEKAKKKAEKISSTISQFSGQININQSQINSLQAQINSLTNDITNITQKLEIRKEELDSRIKIRNKTLRNLYISSRKGFFELIFANQNISTMTQNAIYHLTFVDTSEYLIGSLSENINQYENQRNELTEIKNQIDQQKKDLQILVNKLAQQVRESQTELSSISQQQASLNAQRNEISKTLSELSAKQRSLLQEKTETFTTSVGDVPTTGDPNARVDYDPGFSPAFAAFSFGAPHRRGMSQYGAKGRAESGQNYKDILRAYYGNIEIKEEDIPRKIKTDKGEFDIDGRYLKGLAEMPASWPMEALKAQAIAARTYALASVGWRTNNSNPSGTICTTEQCQVWSASKADSSSAARWHQAVEETAGIIMVSKDTGEIFSAMYASTSGGYTSSYTSLVHTTPGGWDTKCGSKNCWTSEAYESISGSPWFYRGWYQTRSKKACGRSHPWLDEEEFADIIGALVLYKEDKNNQKHLSQTDAKSCWGEDISDTWSKSKVRDESGIEEVSDVEVVYANNGTTSEVKVKTNKGWLNFSGSDFYAVFNLRAPGAIHMKSMLFNVEVK